MNIFGNQPTQVSQAEKALRPLLMDEGVHVLSSFELNKVASLTYGDLVCDDIFEVMEKILSRPLDTTPLTLQKTLVVLKHILIYGSEKCVNSGYGIGKFVADLTEFNTVLAAQQQQGAMAFFQRIQGGGVDKGGPIREAAKDVTKLLSNINQLQQIRNQSASQESLVPIGDSNQVAFVTDEVRHELLKRRIQKQAKVEIQSNLAKEQGGFGGGYNAKDGRNVVGAAHGIDAMIQMANKQKKQFSDAGPVGPTPEDRILQELAEQAKQEKEEMERLAAEKAATHNENLLNMSSKPNGGGRGEVDLLDFGGDSSASTAIPPSAAVSTGDLLDYTTTSGPSGSGSYTNDLLGLASGMSQPTGAMSGNGGGLLDLMGSPSAPPQGGLDAFSSISMTIPQVSEPSLVSTSLDVRSGRMKGMVMDLSLNTPQNCLAPPPSQFGNRSVEPEDRFSALDALAATTPVNPVTPLDAKLAENRILGLTERKSSFQATRSLSSAAPTPHTHYSLGIAATEAAPSLITPGTGKVATAYGESTGEEDNPWVMGGTAGSGLEPLGPAPGAPPPPPPPP